MMPSDRFITRESSLSTKMLRPNRKHMKFRTVLYEGHQGAEVPVSVGEQPLAQLALDLVHHMHGLLMRRAPIPGGPHLGVAGEPSAVVRLIAHIGRIVEAGPGS